MEEAWRSLFTAVRPVLRQPSLREFQAIAIDMDGTSENASDCTHFVKWCDVLQRCRELLALDAESMVSDGVVLSLADAVADPGQPVKIKESAAQLLLALVDASPSACLQLVGRRGMPLATKGASSQRVVKLIADISRVCGGSCAGVSMEKVDATVSGFSCSYSFKILRAENALCSLSLRGPGRLRSSLDLQGAHLTGGRIWAGSLLLVRWFASFGWRNRHVLELGAGIGFCGLVLAKIGHSVVLSDREPVLLDILQENIDSNGVGEKCRVMPLDWGEVKEDMALRQVLESERFDTVIGTDLVYDDGACNMLVDVLRTALPYGGVALLTNGRFYRYSKVYLGNALRRAGFDVRTSCFKCTGIIQTDFCGCHEPEQEYLMYRVVVPATSATAR